MIRIGSRFSNSFHDIVCPRPRNSDFELLVIPEGILKSSSSRLCQFFEKIWIVHRPQRGSKRHLRALWEESTEECHTRGSRTSSLEQAANGGNIKNTVDVTSPEKVLFGSALSSLYWRYRRSESAEGIRAEKTPHPPQNPELINPPTTHVYNTNNEGRSRFLGGHLVRSVLLHFFVRWNKKMVYQWTYRRYWNMCRSAKFDTRFRKIKKNDEYDRYHRLSIRFSTTST